jgi:3-dehydroquinate synthase
MNFKKFLHVKQTTNIKIGSLTYPVHLGFNLWHEMDQFLLPFLKYEKIYLLTDQNTNGYCLPVLRENVPLIADQPVFSISPGERSKDISSLDRIWTWLLENGAGKNSLLINLGGGVVSDLGGFAAATFQRGMPYINIPTSLIAQVDAAIGGKTGLNISGIKNQAGLFYDPAAVFIMPVFLETLPEAHFKSGFAEIIKCAALSGDRFWELLKKDDATEQDHIMRLIFETVSFKCRVVGEDPFDQSTRKMLNFGHTVGHALESLCNIPGKDIMLHGQAVAAGMMCETYLSNKTAGLEVDDMDELVSVIKSYFDLKPINENKFDRLAEIVNYDKKKTGSGIGFSLLAGLGKHSPGKFVNTSDLISSFRFYNDIIQLR